MAWHMTTLDTHIWLRGEVSELGLTDENVDLLRGIDCDILVQGLIELIEYPYQQGASSFSEAYIEKSPS
jgi:hypothetical protein